MSETREPGPATDADRPSRPLADGPAVAEAQSGARSPRPARRSRARPWLLLLLLVVLIGLLVQRSALRTPTIAFARDTAMDALKLSPRDLYALRLWLAGLDDSALGRRWASAVEHAAPRRFTTRYTTRDGFVADAIQAHVYAITLRRGERFDIRLARDRSCVDCRDTLYAHLERRAPDRDGAGDWTLQAGLTADGRTARHVIDRDGDYRVVLQPELAGRVDYRLSMARGGSLSFPVAGAGARDIGSGFGAPRDGGARQHHGVDIFADRGTPVRAVAAGRVRTASGGIGGKHIWLSSGMVGIGGARYYYAHLDAFAVDSGTRVEAGDIIGRVGNTGNARTTPPHLHFGIYTGAGPVDPAPFLGPPPDLPDG